MVRGSISCFVQAPDEFPSGLVVPAYNGTTHEHDLVECQPCCLELLGLPGNLRDDIAQSLFDEKVSIQNEKNLVVGLIEMLADLFNRMFMVVHQIFHLL